MYVDMYYYHVYIICICVYVICMYIYFKKYIYYINNIYYYIRHPLCIVYKMWAHTNHSCVIQPREFVIVENIRLVRLLDLTADFGVKTNAKLTPIFKAAREGQNWYSKLFVHSNPPVSNLCINFLTYIL